MHKLPLHIAALLGGLALNLAASGIKLTLTALPMYSYDGTYVGLSTAQLPDGSHLPLVCNDYSSKSYVGSTFEVTISSLDNLGAVRFGADPNLYERGALLLSRLPGAGPAGVTAYQFAIWNLFDSGVNISGVPGAQAALNWSATAVNAPWNYSDIRIYTPTAPYASNQEFMSGTATPLTGTPEPASLVLLGSALIAVAALRRGK